jgi:Mg2+ and Co2+ transporter CorA
MIKQILVLIKVRILLTQTKFLQLYNFVAQADSGLNSRVAAAAGLDSAAMKTLAFVTTVFLPPTFVAVSISRIYR